MSEEELCHKPYQCPPFIKEFLRSELPLDFNIKDRPTGLGGGFWVFKGYNDNSGLILEGHLPTVWCIYSYYKDRTELELGDPEFGIKLRHILLEDRIEWFSKSSEKRIKELSLLNTTTEKEQV